MPALKRIGTIRIRDKLRQVDVGQSVRYYIAIGDPESPHHLARVVNCDDAGLCGEIFGEDGWIRDDAVFMQGTASIISKDQVQKIAAKMGLGLRLE